MPNRIIREAILTSERVDVLSPEAEVFYRRILSVADDFGRCDARLAVLIASCYPLRAGIMPQAKVEQLLSECCAGEKPLILRYEVGGKPYLEVQDFRQQLRSARSRFPSPSDAGAQRLHIGCVATAQPLRTYSESYSEITHAHENAQASGHEAVLPSVNDAPFDPVGGEGAIAEWSLAPEPAVENAHVQRTNDAQMREGWFEEFWKQYSRWCHRDRKRAKTTFLRLVKSRKLFERILAAIERQSPEMLARPADKRPYAATWLNGERWEEGEAMPHLATGTPETPESQYRETPDGFADFEPMGNRYRR